MDQDKKTEPLVSVTFIASSSPYHPPDVAGFPAAEAKALVDAGKAQYTDMLDEESRQARERQRVEEALEAERLNAEWAERDRLAAEKVAAEQAEDDRLAAEKVAAEQAEADRLAASASAGKSKKG